MIKRSKKKVVLIMLIAIVAFSMTVFWKIRLSSVYVSKEQIVEGNTLHNVKDYVGSFQTEIGSIQKIAFCNDDTEIDYANRTDDVEISISDADGNIVWQQDFQNIKLSTNAFGESIAVANPQKLEANQLYKLHVFVDDRATDAVSVALYGDRGSLFGLYLVCCVLIMFIVLTSFLLFDSQNIKKMQIGFAIVIVFMGILTNIVMTPLCVPDEDYHFMRTYHISNQILGVREDGYKMAITESGISRMLEFGNVQNSYFYWSDWNYGNQKVDYSSSRYVKYATSASIADIVYVPAAAVLTVCRIAQVPYQILLLLSRMTNLILLVVLALIAMSIFPEIRNAIAAICLLPSTIWMAASFSYDTWNLAFSMLFVTYCCYCNKNVVQMRLKNVLILSALLGLFVPVKIIYIVMAMLIFLISKDKWKDKRLIYGTGIAIVCAAVLIFIVKGQEIIALLTSSMMDTRGIGNAAANSYTIGWVMKHPVKTGLIIIHTVIMYFDKYISKGITGEFFSTYVPSFLIAILILFLGLVMMSTIKTESREKQLRIFMWINFAIGCLSVFMTFLFAYNNISDNQIGIIEGVQGRYFLPFMIYLPWMVNSPKIRKYVLELNSIVGKEILLIGIALASSWVFYCKFAGMALTVLK